MAKNYFDITLALSGICQSVYLVQQLAHQNQCDGQALRISLQSLLDLNPPSVCAVYGNNPRHLQIGLDTLLNFLYSSSRVGFGAELIRYTLGLMLLERKLNNNFVAQTALSHRINALNNLQLSHFDLMSDTLISTMADIYLDTISSLGSRIRITGAPEVLKNSQVQDKVRAILLAGIRSAVLWKQVGGRKLQLMFARNRLCQVAKQIMKYC